MPDSYGDVTGEYRALRGAAALVEDRLDVVRVTGPDAASFLQGILSQDVAAMEIGAVGKTLLLQPNGKMECLATIARDDSGFVLMVERGLGASVRDALSRFLIRVKAEISLNDDPVAEVWGPEAASVLAAHELVAPDGWNGTVLSNPLSGLPRFVVFGSHPWSDDLVRAGDLATEAVRVEAGEPRNGVDMSAKTIPQEVGVVEQSVSFTKGCYLGQELVARIDSRGHVNRHLRGLRMTANVLPPVGSEVVVGEKVVGALSSVVESLTMRAPLALSLIRREVEPGNPVEIRWDGGATTAVVHELPFDDFTNS